MGRVLGLLILRMKHLGDASFSGLGFRECSCSDTLHRAPKP